MKMRVGLKERGYDVYIENGCIGRAGGYFDLNRRVMIVTDTGVPASYALKLAAACGRAFTYVLEQGEASKNVNELTHILSYMTRAGFGRGDCVVAVGGGVCGDIAGFAAAIYMRGIDFYNVPTTLLSQVDSSVGGKTAVDLCGVKNVIGAFKQPKAVLIDPETLRTLPKRQINNGLCEALKTAVTSDPGLFRIFEEDNVYEKLTEVTERSLAVKIKVVEADEYETGLRRVLNFGHTIGHGIEAACSPKLYHGECVALGMLPMCSPELRERLVAIYEKLGLPASYEFDKAAAASAMYHDKKGDGESVLAVYSDAPGSYEIRKTELKELTAKMEEIL